MRNYYEILEVDKNASQEVIDKAYRILAKKYHPDLQQGDMKQECAEKMKIINQAYDVLSNETQRQQYNQQLEEENIRQKQEQERIMRENYELKQRLNRNAEINRNINTNVNNRQTVDEGTIRNMSRVLNEEIQAARQKAYYDAYIQDMKNRGYKIRYKHDFKYYFKLIVDLIIIAGVFFLIYQIPFVKNYFAQLYEENIIFKAIVDIIKNTITTPF